MTAEHGDETARPPAGGDPAGPARFEIVLRGYDRRQVEEHITTLERTIARQRSELEAARSEQPRLEKAYPGAGTAVPQAAHQPQPAAGSSPAGAHREPGGLNPEMISSFTTRLQAILQAAEEEAEQVRGNARAWAQAEEQAGRARIEELERRRQAVLGELGRVRNQLDGLLSQAENHGERAGAPATVGARNMPGTSPSESGPSRPEGGAAATEAVRVDTAPRPAPSAGRPVSGSGGPQPVPSHARPAPSPGAPTPGTSTRSSTPSPARSGQPAQSTPPPAAKPSASKPSPRPKPRPTPSPRPRSSASGGSLPGAEMNPGKPDPGSRNGTTAGGDDDGSSAFGSGAR